MAAAICEAPFMMNGLQTLIENDSTCDGFEIVGDGST